MKHTVIVDGHHDYDISVKKRKRGIKYKMTVSKKSEFSNSLIDDKIFSVVDDGNQIKFSKKLGNSFRYDQFFEMKILLDFIFQIDKEMAPEFEIYKNKNK